MSNFVPNEVFLRGVLLHYFNMKKSATETHRILVKAYGDNAPSVKTCREWFRRFRSGDFDVDKEHSRKRSKTRAFEDEELQALVDKDPCQTQKQLAEALNCTQSVISDRLKVLGKVYKEGKWISYTVKGNKNFEKQNVTDE